MRLRGSSTSFMRAGHLDLKTAQREIASDWIEAYKKYASVFLVAGGADPLLRACSATRADPLAMIKNHQVRMIPLRSERLRTKFGKNLANFLSGRMYSQYRRSCFGRSKSAPGATLTLFPFKRRNKNEYSLKPSPTKPEGSAPEC